MIAAPALALLPHRALAGRMPSVRIIGVRAARPARRGRVLPALVAAAGIAALAGCVPAAGLARLAPKGAATVRPAMAWDHRPEAAAWTAATLAAVASHDEVLAGKVPADIATWCPAYPRAGLAERRAFWAGLISAVGRYESSWNPAASGAGGRYIGIMQISPRSARNYGCTATEAATLKDGSANLTCAVRMVARNVGRDGQVAGPKGNRGIGRDWMPFRKADKRAAMAEWTRAQDWCQG